MSKKQTFSVHNTNALFSMTDGVLAGKTGFTGDAGTVMSVPFKKMTVYLLLHFLLQDGPDTRLTNGTIH